MAVNTKTWGVGSLPLTIGLWLLMNQGAIANSIQTEPTVGEGLTSTPTAQHFAQTEAIAAITEIRIEPTEVGFQVVLVADGVLLPPAQSTSGNALVLDIANATLAEQFRTFAPAEGIALVQATARPGDQVQVTITGSDAVPVVEVSTNDRGLVLGVTPGIAPAGAEDDSIRILVTGEEDDYGVSNATTATRTDTPILEIPAAVQVIPRQLLEDQQVTDLGEALRNLGGVSVNTFEGRGFQINLRGFSDAPLFRDGFRLYAPNDNGDAAGQGFPEIANIEQIEVLRGPASILFGQIEPGGAVNIISKRPLDEPFYEVELQAGSYGFLQPRIDVSGPLTGDRRLLYRLNAVDQNDDGFRDYDRDVERFFISPALTWRPDERTDLNIQLEYLNDERPLDTGLVALGESVANIPYDRNLGERDDFIESEFLSIGYDLEHRFNDDWTLRNAFRYLRDEDDIRAVLSFPFIGGLDEDTGTLNRVFGEQLVNNQTLALQTNVVGQFSTGSIDHTLLFGVDFASYSFESISFTDFSVRTNIDVFDPVYGLVARPDRADEPTSSETITTDSLQFYLQDQIQLLDDLIVVAGVNYEAIHQQTSTTRGGTTTDSELDEAELTPRFGLVYQPLENVSLYASYARSFFPSASVTVDGEPLEPETGEGFEVGVKAELLEGDLLATLSYFNLTKQNVATTDPDDPRFSVATGEQQSEGIELDLVGELAPGWNLLASYAYIDAKVTADNEFTVGNLLPGVAEHSASLWTTYEIQGGDLAGLGFGLGLNWVGDRQGDLDNSFKLDSYFLTNAALFYKQDDWQFALNFKNLFDVDYIAGTPRTRTRGIEPGEPFTVTASVRFRF